MPETNSMPESLDEWKNYFRAVIESARSTAMREAERDELVAFVKREAEEIFDLPF